MAKNWMDYYNSRVGKRFGTGQCVAGYNDYCDWLGIKRNPCVSASQLWRGVNGHDGCKGFEGAPAKPKNGDIIIYGTAGASDGGNGHVGMYHNGRCFGQNQGSADWTQGGPFNTLPAWNGMSILGVYRPRSKYLNNGEGLESITVVNGLVTKVNGKKTP